MVIYISSLLVLCLAGHGIGQVVSYECNSFPVEEGWEEINRHCDPEDWIEDGILFHHVGSGCPEGPNRGQFDYHKNLDDFIDAPDFFIEWRVQTDGDQSEINGTAPAVLAVGNIFGVTYHFTISKDLVRFIRFQRPLILVDIESNTHTFRLELYGEDRYVWYIDGEIADEGVPDGPFPTQRSDFNWRSKAWFLESTTQWDYIRYGRIAKDASGDYDSDDDVDLTDYYYVQECLSNSGPDVDAGPGCRFADFDDDTDVDLRDFAVYQNSFTGNE